MPPHPEATALYCTRCGKIHRAAVIGDSEDHCTCSECELCGLPLLESEQCPDHPTCPECGGYATFDAPVDLQCRCGSLAMRRAG